jgi:uncharacterized membrane protein
MWDVPHLDFRVPVIVSLELHGLYSYGRAGLYFCLPLLLMVYHIFILFYFYLFYFYSLFLGRASI